MSNEIVPSDAASWSRYKQVRKILDEASGDAHRSYQGHDRFWNLPYAEFLKVIIYGVRMIAPPADNAAEAAPAHGCCHAPSGVQAQPGRGAASGLILGLKGLAPFDGIQFPRLPWGGTPVAVADIQFIEKWIDDGCPETDGPLGGPSGVDFTALATGAAFFAPHVGPLNSFRNQVGAVKVRKNINFLTPTELENFRNAVRHMKSLDKYEQDDRSFGYWARIHGNQCQHSWEQFLTWHRAYLYFFEQTAAGRRSDRNSSLLGLGRGPRQCSSVDY
jgi:tyrosinase